MSGHLTLYAMVLSPVCRKVRLAIAEKKQEAVVVFERPWAPSQELLSLNPQGSVPVLCAAKGITIIDEPVISEYVDEVYPAPPLVGRTPLQRAEVRRLVVWFDEYFFTEVTLKITYEKIIKGLSSRVGPNSQVIREGRAALHRHLHYIGWLTERRRWLAGDELSLADLAAAAQLSCVDYTGDVPWAEYPQAKEWYVRIKSRPSFRLLLSETLASVPPAPHYTLLDF